MCIRDSVKSGKALYVGISNYDGPTMVRAAEILEDLKCPFVINQNRYSIFDRTIEQNGLKKTANQMGKGIIAFSPLAQGLLTDKYLHGIPSDSRIAVDGRFLHADALTKEKLAQIEALNKTVSYTHLDVYKRQESNCDNAAHNRTKDGRTCPVDCGKIGNQHNIDTGD